MMERGKGFFSKYVFRLLLFASVFAFFLIIGRSGPILFDDSGSYMRLTWREGVMPFYPLFLLLNQCIFGGGLYLWAVVVEQTFLAAFSIVLLEETVRKRMNLHIAEGVILSVFMLYPYTIEMPTAVMTQAILTEGVAYSFFYIFLTCLLLAVWDKSYGRFFCSFCIALFLSGVRSQLQMLFGVCGVVFCYLLCVRGIGPCGEKRIGKRVFCFLAGLVGCVTIALTGLLLAAGIARGYQAIMQEEHPFYRYALKKQAPEEYQLLFEAKKGHEEEAEVQEGILYEEVAEAELVKRGFPASQYMTLIFSRGMYEADYEDEALFSDPVLKGLYLSLYKAVDAEKQRYVYAREGLWMWKDIVGGIGKIGEICLMVPSNYYVESAQEVIRAADFGAVRTEHMWTIGMTLIKAHFGRFLYHTLMLIPQALVSSVFFQYAPLYGFCHMVTAFLYLSATFLMIWGYVDLRVRKEGAEMMALVLGINVMMVLIISLVFFGQQRYLVYTFGPFYMAYYLLIRQLWQMRIRRLLGKKFVGKIK